MRVQIELTNGTTLAVEVDRGNFPLWQLVQAMQFGPRRSGFAVEDGRGYHEFTASDVASVTVNA